MERLTQKMCCGYGLTDGHKINDLRSMRAVISRLAAYEDTGLSPQAVENLLREIDEDEYLRKKKSICDGYTINDLRNMREIINRLIDYEEDDLEPCVTIGKYATIMALNELKCKNEILRIGELMQADQDGRLVVLPCKVGDTVWLLYEGEVCDVRVQGISLSTDHKDCILHFGGYPCACAWGSAVGKAWFITREAALEAQKGAECEIKQ